MISVSIVLHKTSTELLDRLFKSLEKEEVDKIFLIDNSPDDRLKIYEGKIPGTVYHHIENKGFGNAHNHAIAKAIKLGSEFHLILNPDVCWDGKVIGPLIARMKESDDCAVIQPRIIYPDGRLQHTCRLLPTPYDVFGKRFMPGRFMRKRMQRYLLPEQAYLHEFNAVYMQGSFMLFRTSALQEVGLFDERFFMYPEDIDITRRMRRKYKALYYPEITVIHDHQAASSGFNRMLWIHCKNMVKYFNKWGWIVDKERKKLNNELLNELSQKSFYDK